MPCSIALASVDRSFEEERHSCTIDLQVMLVLPLGPFLDCHLQSCCKEDPVYDLSESLTAFKLSCRDRPEWEHGFHLT